MLSNFKIAILLSYICIASISAAIITPALPVIELDYGLTHGALEWVVSIFLLGYVLGQLIYGPVANRFGRLNALRTGLLLNLFGIILCLIAAKTLLYPLLLIGRLITALGAASGLSCTFMLIHELLPAEKIKQALGFSVVSFTVGIGLAVLLGGLITQYLQWQDCFWLLLFHGLLMYLLTWQFSETLKEKISLHPKIIISGYLKTLQNKKFIVASLMIGFVSAFAYGYSAAAPIYSQTQLHLTPSQYGFWNVLNMVGMFCSGFLSVYLMKHYGPKHVLWFVIGSIIPALISLISLSLTVHASAIWFFGTMTWLYLFTGLLFPVGSYFANNSIDDKASASSMMSFINMGSAMLSVIILGYLPFTPIVSFTLVLAMFFILVTVGTLLILRP